MIESIHQSSANMALRCGEQFRRRYIENEIIPPGIAASCGTGVHEGNRVNLKQKIQSKIDLPLSDIKDATRDGYVHALRNGVYLPKEDKPAKNQLINDGLNKALRLSELYLDEVAPGIQPISTEEHFIVDIGLEFPIEGQMDYQTEPKIGDLKTAGKSWSEGQIGKEIQPIFYTLAHEKKTGERLPFEYDILVDLKSGPKLQIQDIYPTDHHYRALIKKIEMVIRMIKTGTFLPANPSSWWCSPNWCGYFYTCQYQN